MKILALQLKRIGDLVLTAPALAEVRRRYPEASVTLVVADAAAELLPAFPTIDEGWVFRRKGANASFWKKLLLSRFDVCLDFTGTDRSAVCAVLSKASQRVAFRGIKEGRFRGLIYNRWVESAVRDQHTVDHLLAMPLQILGTDTFGEGKGTDTFGEGKGTDTFGEGKGTDTFGLQRVAGLGDRPFVVPASAFQRADALLGDRPFVVIHPGTARPEKYWEPERWAALIGHVQREHGIRCVLTGGPDAFEQAHLARIQGGLKEPCLDLSGKIDLLTFAAVLARARACLSCDTAAVHLAAAFSRPQIALYGLTNPFHWRPRHAAAVVLSAAQPDGPMREFTPRMKGALMSAISTDAVIRATDALLSTLNPIGEREKIGSG